ncbi:hypothetical protein A0127_05525 [Thermococcus peptonophilus]|uniref:Uncharacterized protein n=1 Tax=Thermococcus peptonophilus TaxID=53952 RepID=A0A142CV63_9EURY|nr:hypothetical protein A0127_05525 [Thermococcus peptonophilus]
METAELMVSPKTTTVNSIQRIFLMGSPILQLLIVYKNFSIVILLYCQRKLTKNGRETIKL